MPCAYLPPPVPQTTVRCRCLSCDRIVPNITRHLISVPSLCPYCNFGGMNYSFQHLHIVCHCCEQENLHEGCEFDGISINLPQRCTKCRYRLDGAENLWVWRWTGLVHPFLKDWDECRSTFVGACWEVRHEWGWWPEWRKIENEVVNVWMRIVKKLLEKKALEAREQGQQHEELWADK